MRQQSEWKRASHREGGVGLDTGRLGQLWDPVARTVCLELKVSVKKC